MNSSVNPPAADNQTFTFFPTSVEDVPDKPRRSPEEEVEFKRALAERIAKDQAAASVAKSVKLRKIYGEISSVPSQDGPDGIRFDFCDGCRVRIPAGKAFRVRITDAATGMIVYDEAIPAKDEDQIVFSNRKFFVDYRLQIFNAAGAPILDHRMNLTGQTVAVMMPVGTLGDPIAWFSYCEAFAAQHPGVKLVIVMSAVVAEILRAQYPDFEFVTETAGRDFYAAYRVGLFFDDDSNRQPADYRYVGLAHTAGKILGVRRKIETPPRVNLTAPRRIHGRYAVIATQATSQCKYWNNPTGWYELIKYLLNNGYRVLCIDREPAHGEGLYCNRIPWGAEDFTGDRPLQERIDLIKGADFFVGLSSGLSWLAWCCRIPVVLISGFTEPENEFPTPYRVINYQCCHGCWNDSRITFDHTFLWCPRHGGTPRQFECSRLITARQVIAAIEEIPSVQRKKVQKSKTAEKISASRGI